MVSRSTKQLIAWGATLGWTALVVYLMVTPGENSTADEVSDFFGGSDITDAIGHIALFAVLALLWNGALSLHLPRRRALLLTVAISIGLGGGTELAQIYVPDRAVVLFDFLANWLGAVIATIVLQRWHGKMQRSP